MKLLKPNRVVKSAIFSFAFLSLFFFNSCKKLVDSVDEPYIPGASSGTSKSIIAPEEITATQGAKQKITLSWAVVPGAVYYHIYYAYNANDEFVKLDETDKNFYEDKVGPGATVYYKIVAEKASGEKSEFSKTIKGTSLAVPTICDGVFEQDEATIYWYMQNSRDERSGEDNYEANLQFIVTCRNEETGILKEEKQLNGYADHYTFKGLETNCSYSYCVSAFLTSAQTETEDSPEVNATTLLAYTPQQPEFTVSQGTFSTGIELAITLPSKVQVDTITTESPNDKILVNYPLYFEIQRKLKTEPEDAFRKVTNVYYTGSTDVPASYDSYSAGNVIKWLDTESLVRGAEYSYRIKSYTDINYSPSIGSDYGDTKYSKLKEPDGGWPYGWISNKPEFNRTHINKYTVDGKPSYYKKESDASDAKIIEVALGFTLEWNDKGKAGDYKFAIKQSRRDINDKSKQISETWLSNGSGNLFNSLAEVNSREVIFSDDLDLDAQMGYYIYTLYIIPKTYTDAASGAGNALEVVEAPDHEPISSDSRRTKPTITKIVSGYKDKVVIEYNVEAGAEYRLERYIKKYNATENKEELVKVADIPASKVGTNGTYTDKNDPSITDEEKKIKSGVEYTYKLISKFYVIEDEATGTAKTLGIPEPKFDEEGLQYDKITVKMPETLAATSYNGSLGTDKTFSFNNNISGSVISGDVVISKDSSGQFTITVNKPDGYNDATQAGNEIEFNIQAIGAATAITAGDNVSDSGKAKTRVLGPANINLQGTASTGVARDSITVKWNKIDGAKGYTVLRTRPKVGEMDEQTDIYFVDTTGKITVKTGEASTSAVKVTADDTFTLVDKQTSAGEYNQTWNMNQDRIAWGLEYTYKVFPVIADGDVDENGVVYKTDTSRKFTYNNIDNVKKSGYTTGYGIDVEASKADYPREIKVSWNVPKSAQGDDTYSPIICYREENATESWNIIPINREVTDNYTYSKAADGKTAWCRFKPDASKYLTKKMECIVFYRNNAEDVKFENSYVAYSNEKKTGETEGKDCGYMFSMPKGGLSTIKPNADTFTEQLSWTLYESADSVRANKPGDNMDAGAHPYTLYVKNLNIKNTKTGSNNWFPIATFDADGGNMTPISYTWYDITVTSSKTVQSINVDVTPGTVNGTDDGKKKIHNGLLKVLRDYKHYYKIVGERKNSEGTVITTSTLADEEDVAYTFRGITDAELMKAGILVFANAIDSIGKLEVNNSNGAVTGTLNGNPGNAYTFNKIDNYSRSMTTPTNSAASTFSITVESFGAYRGDSTTASYIGGINGASAAVKPIDSELKNLASYSGTISIDLISKRTTYIVVTYYVPTSGTVSCGKAKFTFSKPDSVERKQWMPWKMHDYADSYYTESDYGWWDEH